MKTMYQIPQYIFLTVLLATQSVFVHSTIHTLYDEPKTQDEIIRQQRKEELNKRLNNNLTYQEVLKRKNALMGKIRVMKLNSSLHNNKRAIEKRLKEVNTELENISKKEQKNQPKKQLTLAELNQKMDEIELLAQGCESRAQIYARACEETEKDIAAYRYISETLQKSNKQWQEMNKNFEKQNREIEEWNRKHGVCKKLKEEKSKQAQQLAQQNQNNGDAKLAAAGVLGVGVGGGTLLAGFCIPVGVGLMVLGSYALYKGMKKPEN